MENNEVRKKKMYPNLAALKPVAEDINEASRLISEEQNFLRDNPAFEALGAVGGIGAGGAVAAGALYGLGVTGFSAAGITSGLASVGSIVGGGMVAGVFALAAPIVVCASAGLAFGKIIKNSSIDDKKLEIYRNGLRNLAIIHSILCIDYDSFQQTDEDRARLEKLNFLKPVLMNYCYNLQKDLDLVEPIEIAIIKNDIDASVKEINEGDIKLERDSLLSPAKKSQAKESFMALGHEARKLLGYNNEDTKLDNEKEYTDGDILFQELKEEEKVEDLDPNKIDKIDLTISVMAGIIGGISSCFINSNPLDIKKKNDKSTKNASTLLTLLALYLDKNLSNKDKETLKKTKAEDFEKNVKNDGMDGIKNRAQIILDNPLITLLVNLINRIADLKDKIKKIPENEVNAELQKFLRDLLKDLSMAIKNYDFMMQLPKSILILFQKHNLTSLLDKMPVDEFAKKLLEGNFSFKSFVKNSIPSIIVDLIIRISYAVKSYSEGRALDECIPSSIDREKYPKLSNMMLIGYSISVLVNSAKCAFTKNPADININQWYKLVAYLFDFAKYNYFTLKKKWNEKKPEPEAA